MKLLRSCCCCGEKVSDDNNNSESSVSEVCEQPDRRRRRQRATYRYEVVYRREEYSHAADYLDQTDSRASRFDNERSFCDQPIYQNSAVSCRGPSGLGTGVALLRIVFQEALRFVSMAGGSTSVLMGSMSPFFES